MKRKNIYIIPSLGYGGAESFLLRLIPHMKYENIIITLFNTKYDKDRLKNIKVKYITLDPLRTSIKDLYSFFQLAFSLNKKDTIFSWLYIADLFASFLRPDVLDIPPIFEVLKTAFKPGTLNPKAHFGLFPFKWKSNWEESALKIIGQNKPILQVAPVIQRLVFPRAQKAFITWLNKLESLQGISWLISAHYSGKVRFSKNEIQSLKNKINKSDWANNEGDFSFLGWLDQKLLKIGVVPSDPMKKFSN